MVAVGSTSPGPTVLKSIAIPRVESLAPTLSHEAVAYCSMKKKRRGRPSFHTVPAGMRLRFSGTITRPCQEWRSFIKLSAECPKRHRTAPTIVMEIAGNYEESFQDVDRHLLNCFTYKAVKTVLAQLQEMNPTDYTWFYNFTVENRPKDSKVFLKVLLKERQQLGERVLVTRLHLFNKWVKRYEHETVHDAISDENLEILRERLVQTVKWSSNGDEKET